MWFAAVHGELESPIRVVLLDDETVSRMGLAPILADDPSILVTAVAESLSQAMAALRRGAPDVILASADYLGGAAGLDAFAELVASASGSVVFVARDPNSAIVRQVRRLGAAGLISKRSAPAVIRGAVHAASAGAAVFPRSSPRSGTKAPSGREQQIITGVTDGRTNGEITGALGLSTRTTASHLRRCFARYGVSSRTELAMLAVREQWCPNQ